VLEILMPSKVSETLRLTNGRVRELLDRMQRAEDKEVLVKQQDFDTLLGEVTRAAVWLRRVSLLSMSDEDLAKEISEYRDSLEQLQQMLPAIHRKLLAKKVRLEARRLHLMAAAGWANASQGTL
jgi:hypothetical protein